MVAKKKVPPAVAKKVAKHAQGVAKALAKPVVKPSKPKLARSLGAAVAPAIDLAAQIKHLGADSLLPPSKNLMQKEYERAIKCGFVPATQWATPKIEELTLARCAPKPLGSVDKHLVEVAQSARETITRNVTEMRTLFAEAPRKIWDRVTSIRLAVVRKED